MSSNGEKVASGEAFPGIDRGEDFFGGLFSKTFEAGYGAIFASALESTEGADGKLVVESFDFFGPSPWSSKSSKSYCMPGILSLSLLPFRIEDQRTAFRPGHFQKGLKNRNRPNIHHQIEVKELDELNPPSDYLKGFPYQHHNDAKVASASLASLSES